MSTLYLFGISSGNQPKIIQFNP